VHGALGRLRLSSTSRKKKEDISIVRRWITERDRAHRDIEKVLAIGAFDEGIRGRKVDGWR
jgi:hypothetical protein